SGNRPQVRVRHVTPRRPRHRDRQIMGVRRKIPLSGNGRRYLDIRRFLWPQTVAQRVEELTLGETTGAGGVVGGQLLRARGERPDLEELNIEDRAPNAVEPSECSRIRATTVAVAAGVTHDQRASVNYLILPCLPVLYDSAFDRRRG